MTISVERVNWPFSGGMARDYLDNFNKLGHLYEYNPWSTESYQHRLNYLDEHYGSARPIVAESLLRYNQNLGASAQTIHNIELFAQGAQMVITGQQAGITTGPLYTIYKAITTINLATKLTKQLNRDVVPVFWIAAEDHDFVEVNHINVLDQAHHLSRLVLELPDTGRKSVGCIWDETEIQEFLRKLQDNLVETEFSSAIIDFLSEQAQISTNLADWFGRIMGWLFREQGLIMANPMDPVFRQLEAPLFAQILNNHQQLSQALYQGVQAVEAAGFQPQVLAEENHAHLFIYMDGARTALYEQSPGQFGTRDGQRTWTLEELLTLCQDHPESFSTNVVTRPIAQDLLFPVIAYIAGPGEIAYYGLYRKVYQCLNSQMPVIHPRMHATLIEPGVKRLLEKYQLEFQDVVAGLQGKLQKALAEQDEVGIDQRMAQARQEMQTIYDTLIQQLTKIDGSLEKLGQENLERVLGQLEFLGSKAQQKHRHNSEGLVKHYHRLEAALLPGGNRQERVFNVITYLNKFGPDVINQIVELATNVEREHLVVYLG